MRAYLKTVREQKSFTQAYVSNHIGISTRMYQRIEAGQREGKCWIWDALQDLLGVDQRELRAITDNPASSSSVVHVKT